MHQNRSFEQEHTNSPVTLLLDHAVKFLILSSDWSSFFVNYVTRCCVVVFRDAHRRPACSFSRRPVQLATQTLSVGGVSSENSSGFARRMRTGQPRTEIIVR